MASELVYKLVVVDGDKEIVSKNLSYKQVAGIVNDFPGTPTFQYGHGDLYQVAAKHPSSRVRDAVARKYEISAEFCNVLANDASIDLLKTLAINPQFMVPFLKNATIDLLEKFMKKDVEIATTIVDEVFGNIAYYEQADLNKLALLISGHSDPGVLVQLARGPDVPEKVLNALLTHPDPAVSTTAKSSLQHRGGEQAHFTRDL